MPCICCDRSLCCFGATPCEWETGLVSRHVCMKYRYPPASWLPAASALLLGTALGADVSYLHVVLTASSPHVSNLGCTRPWEEVGEFFLRIALGFQPGIRWDKRCPGGMGAGLPWHTQIHEGEPAFWSPSSLALAGWSCRFPGLGAEMGTGRADLPPAPHCPGKHGTSALVPSTSSTGSIPPCPEPGAQLRSK